MNVARDIMLYMSLCNVGGDTLLLDWDQNVSNNKIFIKQGAHTGNDYQYINMSYIGDIRAMETHTEEVFFSFKQHEIQKQWRVPKESYHG